MSSIDSSEGISKTPYVVDSFGGIVGNVSSINSPGSNLGDASFVNSTGGVKGDVPRSRGDSTESKRELVDRMDPLLMEDDTVDGEGRVSWARALLGVE